MPFFIDILIGTFLTSVLDVITALVTLPMQILQQIISGFIPA